MKIIIVSSLLALLVSPVAAYQRDCPGDEGYSYRRALYDKCHSGAFSEYCGGGEDYRQRSLYHRHCRRQLVSGEDELSFDQDERELYRHCRTPGDSGACHTMNHYCHGGGGGGGCYGASLDRYGPSSYNGNGGGGGGSYYNGNEGGGGGGGGGVSEYLCNQPGCNCGACQGAGFGCGNCRLRNLQGCVTLNSVGTCEPGNVSPVNLNDGKGLQCFVDGVYKLVCGGGGEGGNQGGNQGGGGGYYGGTEGGGGMNALPGGQMNQGGGGGYYGGTEGGGGMNALPGGQFDGSGFGGQGYAPVQGHGFALARNAAQGAMIAEEHEGYRSLEGEEEGVALDWVAVALEHYNCSNGCLINLYDTNECSDEALRPLSPMAGISVTYSTDDSGITMGNTTIPGTIEQYLDKVIYFHDNNDGEININEGKDLCGVLQNFTEALSATNGDATATNGDATATNGDATATNGDATATNGDATATNGSGAIIPRVASFLAGVSVLAAMVAGF